MMDVISQVLTGRKRVLRRAGEKRKVDPNQHEQGRHDHAPRRDVPPVHTGRQELHQGEHAVT